MLLAVACAFMWLLQHRFAEWKARFIAIGLTASLSLPYLIPGTLYYGIAGSVLMMVIVLVAKPRWDDKED